MTEPMHDPYERAAYWKAQHDLQAGLAEKLQEETSYWMAQHHTALARAERLDENLDHAVLLLIRFAKEDADDEKARQAFMSSWEYRFRAGRRIPCHPNTPTTRFPHDRRR